MKIRVNLAQASSITDYQQRGLWNGPACGARIMPQANLEIVERYCPAKYLAIVDVKSTSPTLTHLSSMLKESEIANDCELQTEEWCLLDLNTLPAQGTCT